MENLMINKETIEKYIQTNPLDLEEAENLLENCDRNDNLVEFNPYEISDEFLRFTLFNDTNLSNDDKAFLTKEFLENNVNASSLAVNDLWDTKIKSLSDLWNLSDLIKTNTYNADVEFVGRKYPVKMIPYKHNAAKFQIKLVRFTISLKICSILENVSFNISNNDIQVIKREIGVFTFEKLMSIFKIYKQTVSISAYNKTLESSSKMQKESGLQINCKGIGLDYNILIGARDKTLNSIHLDYFEKHSSAIVEGNLELVDENSHRDINHEFRNKTILPFIRIFSFLYKKYLYVHIDDVIAYKYVSARLTTSCSTTKTS